MKNKQTLSRWTLARRLQDMALRIAAGKPVRVGGVLVRVPDQIILEEEVETKDGKTELEFEMKWPVSTGPAAKSSPRRSRRSTS
jgi:amphi-Trp domain-containing protein